VANEASRGRAIQTAPVVLEDLVFTRRILREMQEQKIACEILLRMFSGMKPASAMVEPSSVKVVRLLTISKVIDIPS